MYRIHNALTEIERKLEKIVNVKNFVFAFLFRNSEIKVKISSKWISLICFSPLSNKQSVDCYFTFLS